MANVLVQESSLTAIADAIRNKNGSGTTYLPSEMASAIDAISGGGMPENDVMFYDYDGTAVAGYSKAEFLALTALPAVPSHAGLVSAGWNWTLEDAKAYVTKYSMLDIGASYTVENCTAKLYITISEALLGPFSLGIGVNGSASIDWGDGTTDAVTGSDATTAVYTQHTYDAAGEYEVRITLESGSMRMLGDNTVGSYLMRNTDSNTEVDNTPYHNVVRGAVVNQHGYMPNYAFKSLSRLEFCILDNAGRYSISWNTLQNCRNLKFFTVPSGTTTINGYSFSNTPCMHHISLPKSLTSTSTAMLVSASALKRICIPEGITSIGAAFASSCQALEAVVIPDGVTSIGNQAFKGCRSLENVRIPAEVTSIGTEVFSGCYSLQFIRFEGSTPPAVADSNAFTDIPSSCVIYVPQDSLEDYKAAANYPDSTVYTYVGF